MCNSPVDGATIDQFPRGHIEEDVHDNSACNRSEEYANAEPANRLLLASHVLLFVRVRVQEEVCKDSEHSHGGRAAPGIERVVAIFTSIGDAQKNIPRPKCFPYVVAEAIQPEECGQKAEAEYYVSHNEADVICEICEDADQVCRLTNHQAHGYRSHNIANQISAKRNKCINE